MAEMYKVLGRTYVQGTVINVKENGDIQRGVGGGSYKGTQINFFDKKSGDPESAKMAQVWLDLDYQRDLKDTVQSLKSGDEITIYKQREGKASLVEGKSDEEIKEQRLAFWGVKSIHMGHVIPPEMADAPANQSGGKTVAERGGYDSKGVAIGHAIKCANRLLTPAKAKDNKTFVAAACALHDITVSLQEEFNDVNKGAIGLAVLEASIRCKEFKEVNDVVRGIITEVNPLVTEHVEAAIEQRKADKKAKKEAEKVAKEAPKAEAEEADIEEDISEVIPF